MKLQSKGARRTLGVTCSATIVAAGASLFAAVPAFAASTLTLSPSATSITAVDLAGDSAVWDVSNGSGKLTNGGAALANASYGLYVSGSSSGTLKLVLDTAPASSNLWYGVGSSTTATPFVGGTTTTTTLNSVAAPSAGNTTDSSAITPPTSSQAIYVAADTPGTYTLHFADTAGTPSAATGVSPEITLNVLGVQSTTDNASGNASLWKPSVTVSPTVTDVGTPVTAAVDLSGISADVRGVNTFRTALAPLVGVSFARTSSSDNLGDSASSIGYAAGATTGTRTLAAGETNGSTCSTTAFVCHAGAGATITTTAAFSITGNSTFGGDTLGTAAVTLSAANTVSAVPTVVATQDSTGVSNNSSSATATTIKAGRAAATFTSTPSCGGTCPVGTAVYYTLTPGVDQPGLTATGGTLVGTDATGDPIYRVLTDSNGVATIVVTSSVTTAGTTYKVSDESNGYASANPNVATYETDAATTLAFTNEQANVTNGLVAAPSSDPAITGTIEDQFGAAYTPSTGIATLTFTPVGGAAEPSVTTAVTAGDFSYTYTPAVAPSGGTQTTVQVAVTGLSSQTETINWSGAGTPGSVTLTTPATGGSATLQDGTNGPSSSTTVSGTLLDTTNVGLPYHAVVLTGTPGVWFDTVGTPTATAPLTKTITVATDSSGNFTGAYVYYTTAGTAVITATAGTATATTSVTVSNSIDPFIVSVNNAFGTPGNITISGKVLDLLGNPVPSNRVVLAVTPTGSGTLGENSGSSPLNYVTTASDGTFSDTFDANAGVSGSFTVTATLDNHSNTPFTTNPVASTLWATAGVTGLPTGVYQATSTLTVGPIVLNGPSSHAGQGFINLTGMANPNTVVSIYGRQAHSTTGQVLLDTVTSNAQGDFQVLEWLSDTTTYVASTGSGSTLEYSPSIVVTLGTPGSGGGTTGTGRITALVPRNLGGGKASLTVVGNGNGGTTVTVFIWSGGKWVKLTAVKARANGVQVVIVKTSKGKKTFRVAYSSAGKSTAYMNVSLWVK